MASNHGRKKEFFKEEQHMGVVKAIEGLQMHWRQVGILT
jgi:hypothetical protein